MKRTAMLLIVGVAALLAITPRCQSFSCDWAESFNNMDEIDGDPVPFLTAAAKLRVMDLESGQKKISLEKWAAQHADKGDNICWQACGCGEFNSEGDYESYSHICADLMVGTSNLDYFMISVKMATENRTFLEKPILDALYVKYRENGESAGTFSDFEKAIKRARVQRAFEKGYWNTVDDLFKSGIDVNSMYDSGMTPLHAAVIYNREEFVKRLVSEGANVNAKNQWEATPLHYALTAGIAEILISKGADINLRMFDGDTPLNRAIYGGNVEVSSLLITGGCDLKAIDDNKKTALHIAAVCGQLGTVKLLADKGADINSLDNEGRTPLKLALENNKKDVADYLRSVGGKE